LLNKNIKYLREHQKFSQAFVAKALGMSRSTFAGYEQGKVDPNVSVLKKIASFFRTNVNDLLEKDLGMPLFNQNLQKLNQDKNARTLTVTLSEKKRENIAFVPVSASAGYGQNFDNVEYVRELSGFSLPKHSQGSYRAFEVKGDSMPPIQEGFIIIGQYVENLRNLKSGKRYVLITKNDGVLFKRVTNEVAKKQQISITSDNPVYPTSFIKIVDLLEAWQMVSYIGFPNDDSDMNQIILDKLRIIENKISQLS